MNHQSSTFQSSRYSSKCASLLLFLYLATIHLQTIHASPSSSPTTTRDDDNTSKQPQYYPSFLEMPTPTGNIDDVSCNVEQLEEANDSQLHSILMDLIQTSFFKNFKVDLDQRCPVGTWDDVKHKKKKEEDTEKGNKDGHGNNDEGGNCEGGLDDMDEDAPPACSLSKDNGASFLFDSPTSSSKSTPFSPSSSSKTQSTTFTKTFTKQNDNDDDGKCQGGLDDMDEDAPPACSLVSEDDGGSFLSGLSTQSTSSSTTTSSNGGWDSESVRDTFTWSNPSDPIVQDDANEQEGCEEEALKDGSLPDTFWMDMCSNITLGSGMQNTNLVLNPERNTGYNGTHIWTAIYNENCRSLDGVDSDDMCYEERVLYRLLSGLHASTTLSIAKNYYPPNKRKGRDQWTPNPTYFYEKFGQNPEYIRNVHFSYVVLLRALKKANKVLSEIDIHTGNIIDDETSKILLNRLLESSILRSCSDVFAAFDESLMFQRKEKSGDTIFDGDTPTIPDISLEQNFKGVFHNISSILDCVQCQQCKLHGKMAMLGYGTALKILFLPREDMIASSLSRNEIVAFINTIAKFSEAMKEVRELTSLYWSMDMEAKKPSPTTITITPPSKKDIPTTEIAAVDPVDAAIGATATLKKAGLISDSREGELIGLALKHDPDLMALAKYYASDLTKFLTFSKVIGTLGNAPTEPDAIVIGTGLAGLAATLRILDRGGKVLLIEKEHLLGGNSNKASSGVNACCPHNNTSEDTIQSFIADTTKSAGDGAQPALIQTLVEKSASAVEWLEQRVGVDLSLVAQLGGHKNKRTHRPKNGMVGAEIIYGMQKAVKKYEKTGHVQILLDTKVKKLLQNDDGRVNGVEVDYLVPPSLVQGKSNPIHWKAPNVILATGGFAADRTEKSYLAEYRPELLNMPATAGNFSTGDGVKLSTFIGAGLVDMDKIQIHPTGWVDPADPNNRNKILAGELMRGVGGILVNSEGKRFCNELGTRAYVTDKMLEHDAHYAETKQWNQSNESPTFFLILSSSAAQDAKKHVDHYSHKGLLTKIEGISSLAIWIGLDEHIIRRTMVQYQNSSHAGVDKWGKTSFRGIPSNDLDEEVFYIGKVTPVLHYCMGGISIDVEGNVLDENKNIIQGLHAAGEVTGGVHGVNRLGGNSLLECTVYGSIVGNKIPIQSRDVQLSIDSQPTKTIDDDPPKIREVKNISLNDLSQHNTKDDCWVAIHGNVYDLTDFAEEHPAGAESIYRLGGTDGTEAFQAIHQKSMMDDFDEDLVGVFVG